MALYDIICDLDMKGCICHFVKWQIHPFKPDVGLWCIHFTYKYIETNAVRFFIVYYLLSVTWFLYNNYFQIYTTIYLK